MKLLSSLFLFAVIHAHALSNDSSQLNDYKIAKSIRKAVRKADSTLLQASSLNIWRDYLKIACADLDRDLQPLVLIKFDEDMSFRSHLKTLIDWENKWEKKQTEHFIYYYRWDQPPPEIILEAQDAHFNEVAKRFQIEAREKIPFRYDLNAQESLVYPFDDLRGGIVSPHPIDLESGALAIFYLVSYAPKPLLEPLSKIYGSFFQNPSTTEAYYKKCLKEIEAKDYVSITNLLSREHTENSTALSTSSFVFMYELNQQFGPQKIAEFLSEVNEEMTAEEFGSRFEEVFGTPLSSFEETVGSEESAEKL
ncbi:hypothetical protein GWO43_27490 [candidate division KSB1 bacterium]|nr:hypothetical protein [candidate division KSB1 bacterium]NIR70572.1 hypothetical protein [candidate division KSB1 bacterium]NIS27708.1 hypothetical protein [candidate division KSB1 bacterium]NIT74536.1 hypothetical protein [candidate division KSB1 bacterium]NIU28361.1 hypothetical protein [candidate division KSB1 bacterium]